MPEQLAEQFVVIGRNKIDMRVDHGVPPHSSGFFATKIVVGSKTAIFFVGESIKGIKTDGF